MTEKTMQELSALTADLYFTSETDAAWTIHTLDATQAIMPQLTALSNRQTDTTVEECDWTDFLNNAATVQDWMDEVGRATAARYKSLVDYVTANLSEITVYRLGDIEIDIFVVGLTGDCSPIALATKAVET